MHTMLRWALLVALVAGAVSAQEREPHVLMISIDGLMPSAYLSPGPAQLPHIRRLAAEGAYGAVTGGGSGFVCLLWTRDDIARLGGPADAAFGIDMRTGFYSGDRHAELRTPTMRNDGTGGMRGGHGHSPLRPELRSALVINGPTIHKRGDLGIVRMTQIAPTLARWLGVGSPQADTPIDALVGRTTASH